ncbi:carbamoyltransferase HypF [Desulfobacterota bacterium M19]
MTGTKITVRGIVQGVGFRPFVYRLAAEMGLSGSVSNTREGVDICLTTQEKATVESFITALRQQAPPMARLEYVSRRPLTGTTPAAGFKIIKSETESPLRGVTPPDTAVCAACRSELFDPADRRFLYPFINCTDCGPRFTIISAIPYDRPQTSMGAFKMCGDCAAEYRNPASRRFHAQPDACWACGPRLSWHDHLGHELTTASPIQAAARALSRGKIVAIRGLGGFHLAINAADEETVLRLRRRKGRPAKALAIMAADINLVRHLCYLSTPEIQALEGPERPIVLLQRREPDGLAASLTPNLNELGVMLPYTPLHYILFAASACPAALVMTSGNPSAEPICAANDEAISRLQGIADFFLLHNREITARADDSVLRIVSEQRILLRRSRGYVPSPLALGLDLPPLIACGAELKNTFCLAQGQQAVLSQHIGDLGHPGYLDFFKQSVRHLRRLTGIKPRLAVCDEHPDYQSSVYARELRLPLFKVQHHHAHAAAVMAEHRLQSGLAIILDGAGLGTDKAVWGGEILLTNHLEYQRQGHLQYLPLPGGDAASRQGWRLAVALCVLKGQPLPPHLQEIDKPKRQMIAAMIKAGVNCPPTSSAGRLFDAAAAILGLRMQSTYEGQAAMELEAIAWQAMRGKSLRKVLARAPILPAAVYEKNNHVMTIKTVPMLMGMLNLSRRHKVNDLALDFHLWLCRALSALAGQLNKTDNLPMILGGGCLQNNLLRQGLTFLLKEQNFKVYSGEKVPVNDGGLALGQALIGGSRYVSRHTHAGC